MYMNLAMSVAEVGFRGLCVCVCMCVFAIALRADIHNSSVCIEGLTLRP